MRILPNASSLRRKAIPRVFPWEGPSLIETASRLSRSERPLLLESVCGPADLARYSVLGWDPFAVLSCERGSSVLSRRTGVALPFPDSPFEALRKALTAFEVEPAETLHPFLAGGIGWLSYELGRWIERLPARAPDEFRIPELWFALLDRFLVEDRATGKVDLVLLEIEGDPLLSGAGSVERRRQEAVRVADRAPRSLSPFRVQGIRADHDRRSYGEAVLRAKEHILDGDIYQVNLSQRFDGRAFGDSWDLYRRLRESNPAPYAAYLDSGRGEVLSSSPEMYLRIRGREIETRPIKGTRPRTGDAAADAAARAELLGSEKDRAELTMIVDLERNDFHRVCETGSVRVPRLLGLEEYETVFHLVSTVQGRLRPEADLVDCLRATFPGGSVTGAPKIRAMEILSVLEGSPRSVYTGAIGWAGFDGGAEFNIAIRTLLRQDDRLQYRVGGGIVADSVPESEYEETLHKGRGMARALGMPP